MGQKFRFLLGGLLNTLVAATTYYLFSLITLEGIALALSFWITFICSYLVNSNFVFKNKGVKIYFLIAVLIAFFVQQAVGATTIMLGGRGMLVFLIVSIIHVPLFYCICRFWVFKETHEA